MLICAASCNKPHDSIPKLSADLDKSPRVGSDEIDELYEKEPMSNLKREFGKALVKSMNESKALRDLIRAKALEMFNKDYDVLYGMIADEKLENGITVNDLMIRNMSDKETMSDLDNISPTLTILVPELPENSFNAEKWDTSKEIPRVAIRLTKSNDVPIIDGTERILEWEYTPAFPVLVIKDNERVVSDKDREFSKKSTRQFLSKSGRKYRFTFDNYDKHKEKSKRIAFFGSDMDPKLLTAYNTYLNTDGWQRDYIYYDISPSQDRGVFNYDFKEKIKTFSLVGDPMTAYNKISDQTDDPRILQNTLHPTSSWTNGNFDFKVSTLINAKNGVGTGHVTAFGATPDDLFNLTYELVESYPFNYYRLTNVELDYYYIDNGGLELINWDLNEYASSINIRIEEVDNTTTTHLQETSTVKFAANFAIEATVLKKIGIKFGASLENTQTQTYQRSFTQDNDLLGSVIVNFGDDVVLNTYGNGSTAHTREYATGYYSISVEPTRVQGTP
ncbi:hypothetical protein GCM10007390_26700 [Persicitalea jodogahamensis]|uniref:Uncharacterized protein n=2 Tax=Persicitalea jodogahamensis TaxID=402147 RepID=A0A8J3D9C9_9BACT|nr:hypothetical protein GCM10007390_26700 [Persicitalea jodogahamensis]